MPVNKEFVSLTNDIFKVPIQTHAYRGYAILPASSKASNAIDVCTQYLSLINSIKMFIYNLKLLCHLI